MSLISYLFIGLIVLVLPWFSFQSKEILDEHIEMPPRRDLYLQSIIMLSVIGIISAVINWKDDLEIPWIGLVTTKVILFASILYALSMAVNIIQSKYFQPEDSKNEDFLLPENKTEYLLWLLLCFTAAWSEELTYRGVLTGVLEKSGMMSILAILLSAVCFSFSHFTQGWLAIPITFVFALGFQYLYKISGSLIVPIVVHFVYNLSVEWIRKYLVKKPE